MLQMALPDLIILSPFSPIYNPQSSRLGDTQYPEFSKFTLTFRLTFSFPRHSLTII